MTFAEACDWSLMRSVLLTVGALPACLWLESSLRSSRRPMVCLWLLASPFLFPELLLGYLFAPWTVGRPWRAELVCSLVLLLRSLPIGVIALWNAPTADISSAALFLRRLKLQSLRDVWELARCYWYGPVRRVLPAMGLVFLVTFQEFEAAALLGAVSWTDRLFVEYATGLSLGGSLRFLMRPLSMQLIVLGLLGWSLWHRASEDSPLDREPSPTIGGLSRRAAELACVLIFLTGVVLPMFLLLRELSTGWMWLWTQPAAVKSLATEMLTSGLVALVAGLAAFCLPLFLLRPLAPASGERARERGRVLQNAWLGKWSVFGKKTQGATGAGCDSINRPPLPNPLPRSGGEGTRSKMRLGIIGLSVLPGLCGGLTISLVVLSLTTGFIPRWITATPLPWVAALVVWLLPRSLLLQTWLTRHSDPAAMHLIELLQQSPHSRQRAVAARWWWRWRIEPQIAIVGVLCYWAYLDLTVSAILHPPGLMPVMVRLYNFMHFGHSAAMSMEAAVVMFLPVVAWALMMAVARSMRWVPR